MNMPKDDLTSLEEYLYESGNSHAKESLINNRLFYDLKLAAARRGYFLNIYHPEIDHEGFDVILDDGDCLLKVQLKTKMKEAATNSWKIHKTLLRPNIDTHEDLGFEASATGTGYQGGIILIEVEDDNNALKVDYYYTDIILILGIESEIVNMIKPPTKKMLMSFFKKLQAGTSHETITVPMKLFFKACSAEGLLALMGLHNDTNTGYWRYHIQKIVNCSDESKLPAPIAVMKKHINEEIGSISDSVIHP